MHIKEEYIDDNAYYYRAWALLELGQYERALADSIRLTEQYPSYYDNWYLKIHNLVGLGRFVEAYKTVEYAMRCVNKEG